MNGNKLASIVLFIISVILLHVTNTHVSIGWWSMGYIVSGGFGALAVHYFLDHHHNEE